MRVQIVSFNCVLKNKLGHFISESVNQDVIATPSDEEIHALPGFVEALKDLKRGDRKQITVPAEHAYGFYIPQLCVSVPRRKLIRGKDLKVGDEVRGQVRIDGAPALFRVVKASKDEVLLDGNHPLAGQDLIFDVFVTDSYFERKADQNELAEKENKLGLLH